MKQITRTYLIGLRTRHLWKGKGIYELDKKLRELFQEENIKITERVKILDSEITLNVNRIPSLEDLYSF